MHGNNKNVCVPEETSNQKLQVCSNNVLTPRIDHGAGSKLVTKHVLYQKLVNFMQRKNISLLTGFKLPSLLSKCVFDRPEHKANRGLKKRVDEINGVKMFKIW